LRPVLHALTGPEDTSLARAPRSARRATPSSFASFASPGRIRALLGHVLTGLHRIDLLIQVGARYEFRQPDLRRVLLDDRRT
jgi:hypothetical protein